MSTPDTVSEMEERLRAALDARAELVRPEDLAPLAPVVELRPRWQSPWVLLATAAVVLLVLGVVFQGVAGRQRSDDVAPKPDAPEVTLPSDVGRDWEPDDLSTPARLDLDGDGTKEKVVFLAEPTAKLDGRTRVQTTLSSTGEEAYGLVELGTTSGTTALPPIDADGNGDEELVLYTQPTGGPGEPFSPVVLDLRDGLLVQAVPEDAGLLSGGYAPVPGSATDYYDLVHLQSFFVEDGTLVSTRSVNPFARGGMTLLQPENYLVDTYRWTLGEDGVLRHGEAGCLVVVPESTTACGPGAADDLPYVTSESTDTIGVGEEVELSGGFGITVRLEPGDPPSIVVEGPGPNPFSQLLDVPDPEINVLAANSVYQDGGAALVLTSAADPTDMHVLVQVGAPAGLVELEPVGDTPFGTGETADGRTYRSWLTEAETLVTVVEGDDGSWEAWRWMMVGRDQMTALPWGTICFDDVDDPTTGHAC